MVSDPSRLPHSPSGFLESGRSDTDAHLGAGNGNAGSDNGTGGESYALGISSADGNAGVRKSHSGPDADVDPGIGDL
ncbi:hypothetical protein HY734_03745 [Candidatus Uhrbacteria bacterium]|nr:hypothetical protein [Candidatus Uhrbacteria bacterium]